MFSRSALLATFTLALAVAANPVVQIRDAPVTLPMVKRMNFTGTATLLERDQKRVQGFKARANAKLDGQSSLVEDAAGSVTATYQLVDYTVDVCSRIFLHLACICLHCT
jgi:cathepsin E